MKNLFIIAVCFLIPAWLSGQGSEEAEQWLLEMTDPESGDVDEAVIESVSTLLEEPLNLNTANEQELEASGLFSPYQVYGLLRYRKEQGRIYSIYELATIPGYSREFLEDIEPFVNFISNTYLHSSRSDGLLLVNTSLKWPLSIAFVSNDTLPAFYPGSPLKNSFRLKHSSGTFNLGVAMEKDPGEMLLTDRRPDHLTGYLDWNPGSIIRQVIVGNFRMHSGLGLVHGLGFRGSGTGVKLQGYRTSYARPFASTAEYGYYRGAFIELGRRTWRTSAFVAQQPADLSLFGLNSLSANINLANAVRETGYHRSPAERAGCGLGKQYAAGWNLSRISQHWNSGMSVSLSSVRLTRTGKDSVPWLPVDHSPNGNVSLYTTWHGNRSDIFGEVAMDHAAQIALLAGATTDINPFLSAYASFRRYEPGFRGQYPSAYGTGSDPENETGLNAGLRIVPFHGARLQMDTDICYHPSGTYRSDFPGYTMRHSADLSISVQPSFEIRMNYSAKEWRDDQQPDGSVTHVTGIFTRHRLRISYSLHPTASVRFSGRMEQGFLSAPEGRHTGSLTYQQITIKRERFGLNLRFLLFDTDAWENRIYAYEPGVRYSFSFPSYYGRGTRSTAVASIKISKRLKLRLKYGTTHYAHRHETGTGRDARPGDTVRDAEIQLEMKW